MESRWHSTCGKIGIFWHCSWLFLDNTGKMVSQGSSLSHCINRLRLWLIVAVYSVFSPPWKQISQFFFSEGSSTFHFSWWQTGVGGKPPCSNYLAGFDPYWSYSVCTTFLAFGSSKITNPLAARSVMRRTLWRWQTVCSFAVLLPMFLLLDDIGGDDKQIALPPGYLALRHVAGIRFVPNFLVLLYYCHTFSLLSYRHIVPLYYCHTFSLMSYCHIVPQAMFSPLLQIEVNPNTEHLIQVRRRCNRFSSWLPAK